MKRIVSLLLVLSLLLALPMGQGETVPLEEAEELTEAAHPAEIAGPEEEELPPEDAKPEEAEIAGEEPEAVPLAEQDNPEEDEVRPEDLPDEEDLEEEIVENRVLQYGDEGQDVMELQIRLSELKYYTGNLSGRYREGTRAAVKNFQKDYGLEETGIADMETQNQLFRPG